MLTFGLLCILWDLQRLDDDSSQRDDSFPCQVSEAGQYEGCYSLEIL